MDSEPMDEYTRGLLDARRAYAKEWAAATDNEISAIDFTPDRLRAELQSRWLERRCLADGSVPAVGQRVVTVLEVAERWGLGHGHDDLVHEITSLLGGDCHLVECGPEQIGVGMLRLAPAGSVVTCSACRGWHAENERRRIDAQVFRETQFKVAELTADRDRHARRAEAATVRADLHDTAVKMLCRDFAITASDPDRMHAVDAALVAAGHHRKLQAEVLRLRARVRVEVGDIAGVTWAHVEAWLTAKGWTTPRVDSYGWVTSWNSTNLEQHDLARADRPEAERVAQAVDYLADALIPPRSGFVLLDEMAAIEVPS